MRLGLGPRRCRNFCCGGGGSEGSYGEGEVRGVYIGFGHKCSLPKPNAFGLLVYSFELCSL
jgi:hypothetical protein